MSPELPELPVPRTRPATYTFDEHIEGKPESIQSLVHSIREFILGLDPAVEEVPKKFYVAYKISQNIVCMETKGKSIKLFVKLGASDIESPPASYRDVTNVGHYGTGDAEFTVSTESEFEQVKPFITDFRVTLFMQLSLLDFFCIICRKPWPGMGLRIVTLSKPTSQCYAP